MEDVADNELISSDWLVFRCEVFLFTLVGGRVSCEADDM